MSLAHRSTGYKVTKTPQHSILLKFVQGYGYWDVTKYPYGGDFKRFKENAQGTFEKGTVKNANEIRFKLSNNTIGVVAANAVKNHSYNKTISVFNRLYKQG